jgi:hypothetical protein
MKIRQLFRILVTKEVKIHTHQYIWAYTYLQYKAKNKRINLSEPNYKQVNHVGMASGRNIFGIFD